MGADKMQIAQSSSTQTLDLRKTKICPNITKTGHCEMGDQCNFAHSELELRSTPNLYKTALCNSFMSGECKLGEYCRFAHGEAELRMKPITEPTTCTYFPNVPNYGGPFMQRQYGNNNGGMHNNMENNFRNKPYDNRRDNRG